MQYNFLIGTYIGPIVQQHYFMSFGGYVYNLT